MLKATLAEMNPLRMASMVELAHWAVKIQVKVAAKVVAGWTMEEVAAVMVELWVANALLLKGCWAAILLVAKEANSSYDGTRAEVGL